VDSAIHLSNHWPLAFNLNLPSFVNYTKRSPTGFVFLQNNTFIANQKKFWELIDSWHKDCQKASSLNSQNKQVSLYTLFVPVVLDVCPVRCHVQKSTLMRFILLMLDIMKCPLTCLVPRRLSFDENVRAKEGGKETTPSVPFPSSLAVHHQSLVSRSPLPCEKRSAWGGGCPLTLILT